MTDTPTPPTIRGKAAIHDPGGGLGIFSDWRCPICNAHLAITTNICLNACHLSKRSLDRFYAWMRRLPEEG